MHGLNCGVRVQVLDFRFLALVRFFEDFFLEDFFRGTFLPSRRASDNPIAIACLRLLTLRPERPLRNVPALRFRIARPTLADAFLEYFRAMRVLPACDEVIHRRPGLFQICNGKPDPLIRRAQAIADAGFSQHVLRSLGIGFDLLPELAHIDPQILRIRQLIP